MERSVIWVGCCRSVLIDQSNGQENGWLVGGLIQTRRLIKEGSIGMGCCSTLRIEQLDGPDSGCIVAGPSVQSDLTYRNADDLFLVCRSEVT